MKPRIFLLPIFVCAVLFLRAQQARQYSFRHFSVTNGLASNTVNMSLQDGDGFIWIATSNGLQRYDGTSFLSFKTDPNKKNSIPSNHIVSVFLGQKNELWLIGKDNRVGFFDTRKFGFTEVTKSDGKPIKNPYEFFRTHSGKLMLRSSEGLFLYDSVRKQLQTNDQEILLPPNWHDNKISWDADRKKYWITCDSGIVQFDPATRRLNYRGHNPDKVSLIEQYKEFRWPASIFANPDGRIIFSHWPSNSGSPVIHSFHPEKGTHEQYMLNAALRVYHEINGFLLQKSGRLWVYGMPFFVEWVGKNFEPLLGENLDEPRIKFDYANNVFEDRERNIWIATDNGIFLFNPDAQIFNTYGLLRPGDEGAVERSVTSVTQMNDGKIFVGTWGSAGLYCFDQNFVPIQLPKGFGESSKLYNVWDMAVNPKTGHLWITQQAGRLSVYDPRKGRVTDMLPEIFKGSTIRQVDEDTSGNMWFGTQSGSIIKWDRKAAGDDPSKGYQLIHKTGMVLKVHYDYKGYIWVGTLDRGLLKIDTRTNAVVAIFTKDGPAGSRLFSNMVKDMTYYNDTTLVVVAESLNILNTRTNKIRFMTAEDGLPSNTVESVERDSKNILWLGMTNGICRVKLEKKLVSYYDRRDGLAYDKFVNAGVQELNDGRLVFFTDHNFLVFNPATIEQKSSPPRPMITGVEVGGRPIRLDSVMNGSKISVNYDNTSLEFSFSALSYLQQTKLHFFYKLVGVDDDWVHTDKPMEVVYNHLAPGNYTFMVKSENADGISNPTTAKIEIQVKPPFWNTWWFYGLVILLVITILYVIDKERMNKRASMRTMRRQIAGNLHTEISKTLNNINVLSEIAKIKADKNVEQSKEFIGQISNKSRYMIEAMDDMLWSLDPQNDSMRKTVLRIKELTENMRSSYDVDIDLIVDHKVQSMELDMKFRHELYFFYKESLTFLLQHIACTQLFININQVKARIMIEIIAECSAETSDCVDRFKKAVQGRTQALNGNLDAIADTTSFSAVLYANI